MRVAGTRAMYDATHGWTGGIGRDSGYDSTDSERRKRSLERERERERVRERKRTWGMIALTRKAATGAFVSLALESGGCSGCMWVYSRGVDSCSFVEGGGGGFGMCLSGGGGTWGV